MRLFCLYLLGILSIFCFLVECYELLFGVDIAWSDHLHNLIDHIMYLVINYIGIKVYKNGFKSTF